MNLKMRRETGKAVSMTGLVDSFNPGRSAVGAALAIALLPGLASPVQAQTYPVRPVTLSSPYQFVAAGEAVVRALLGSMEKQFGQRIVMEYRLGGNEVPNLTAVLNGPSDGYL